MYKVQTLVTAGCLSLEDFPEWEFHTAIPWGWDRILISLEASIEEASDEAAFEAARRLISRTLEHYLIFAAVLFDTRDGHILCTEESLLKFD